MGKTVGVTEKQLDKNNRLCELMELHRQWKEKKSASCGDAAETEGKMGKPKGTCEACGMESTRLRTDTGKQVCSQCQIMRSRIRNKPEVVVEALREFHGEKYFSDSSASEQPIEGSSDLMSMIWEVARLDGIRNSQRVIYLYQHILGMSMALDVQNERIENCDKGLAVISDRIEKPDSAFFSQYLDGLSMALDLQNARVEKMETEITKVIETLQLGKEAGRSWADVLLEGVAMNTAAFDKAQQLNQENDALWEKLRDAYGASGTESKYDLVYSAICLEEGYRQQGQELVSLRSMNDGVVCYLGRVCEALGLEVDAPVEGVLQCISQLQQANVALDEAVVFGGSLECTLGTAIDQGGKHSTMLDLALAALRGDGNMMADCLEMMRIQGEV